VARAEIVHQSLSLLREWYSSKDERTKPTGSLKWMAELLEPRWEKEVMNEMIK
jgi:hypothetical protein